MRRLASAEVAQSPSGVAKHAELVVLAEEVKEWPESTLLEDIITARRAVAGNVTQSPNRLLAHVRDRRRQELDEFRDGLGVDDHLSVVGRTGGDVSHGPCSLKLP